jgi:hypothetical protein
MQACSFCYAAKGEGSWREKGKKNYVYETLCW